MDKEKPKSTNIKLVEFKRDTTRPDVIKALEDMLEKAKKGEITAVFASCICPNDEVMAVWSQTDDIFTALGAIDLLKHRVISQI